jgi:hypothetical protein
MQTNLKTNEALLGRLAAAARRGVSSEDRRKQRLSFVYGNLPKGSDMTKTQVEEALDHIDELEGRA